jgi:hypothetical protein
MLDGAGLTGASKGCCLFRILNANDPLDQLNVVPATFIRAPWRFALSESGVGVDA